MALLSQKLCHDLVS